MGAEITIYMPFVIKTIGITHQTIQNYTEYLDVNAQTTSFNVTSYIVSILEKNDPFFFKNVVVTKKKDKQSVSIDTIRTTNETHNSGVLSNKYFQDALNALKVSLALYYNKGKNIGYPDFAVCVCMRLRKVIQSYNDQVTNLKIKITQEAKKDSRMVIYKSRIQRIEKFIESIQKASKQVTDQRNDYVRNVTTDEHNYAKLMTYLEQGVNNHPQLYKESRDLMKT
jgi:hypothetical protein